MVEGEGFEPSKAEPPDLQSGPFDRLGTPPEKAPDSAENEAPCQCAKGISRKEIAALCPGAPGPFESGAASTIRTLDLLITSELLYP